MSVQAVIVIGAPIETAGCRATATAIAIPFCGDASRSAGSSSPSRGHSSVSLSGCQTMRSPFEGPAGVLAKAGEGHRAASRRLVSPFLTCTLVPSTVRGRMSLIEPSASTTIVFSFKPADRFRMPYIIADPSRGANRSLFQPVSENTRQNGEATHQLLGSGHRTQYTTIGRMTRDRQRPRPAYARARNCHQADRCRLGNGTRHDCRSFI